MIHTLSEGMWNVQTHTLYIPMCINTYTSQKNIKQTLFYLQDLLKEPELGSVESTLCLWLVSLCEAAVRRPPGLTPQQDSHSPTDAAPAPAPWGSVWSSSNSAQRGTATRYVIYNAFYTLPLLPPLTTLESNVKICWGQWLPKHTLQ